MSRMIDSLLTDCNNNIYIAVIHCLAMKQIRAENVAIYAEHM